MSHHEHNPKHPPVLLEQLASSLLWPSALRGPAMAFQPSRWALGIACVLAFRGLLALANVLDIPAAVRLTRTVTRGVGDVYGASMTLDPAAIGRAIEGRLAVPVRGVLREDPVAFTLTGLIFLLVWAVFMSAIARSSATQIATGVTRPALSNLRFGVTSLRAVYASFLLPIVAASLLAFVAWGLASAFPALPLLAFVPTLVMIVILVLHGASWFFLPPAVACERTDAMDALQRCGAYLLTKPLRLLLYSAIAVAVGALAWSVLAFIVDGAIHTTHALTGSPDAPDAASLWIRAAHLLTQGYLVSLIATSATIVYLLIRRVCDEQDVRDIALDGPPPSVRVHDATGAP